MSKRNPMGKTKVEKIKLQSIQNISILKTSSIRLQLNTSLSIIGFFSSSLILSVHFILDTVWLISAPYPSQQSRGYKSGLGIKLCDGTDNRGHSNRCIFWKHSQPFPTPQIYQKVLFYLFQKMHFGHKFVCAFIWGIDLHSGSVCFVFYKNRTRNLCRYIQFCSACNRYGNVSCRDIGKFRLLSLTDDIVRDIFCIFLQIHP